MYGDSAVIRERARSLRAQGDSLRTLTDRLTVEAEQAGRHTRAATTLGGLMRERAAHLREVAARHDAAAAAMEAHLHEVAHLQQLIAGIEREAETLVAEARIRLARGAGPGIRLVPDPEDAELAAFVGPPSGHRDWLAVELPGL